MADSIKINKLEIENVKRIKAVKIEPTKNGLTIVGGNNNQGKTSVLDSIAWALGGDRYKEVLTIWMWQDCHVLPVGTCFLMKSNISRRIQMSAERW